MIVPMIVIVLILIKVSFLPSGRWRTLTWSFRGRGENILDKKYQQGHVSPPPLGDLRTPPKAFNTPYFCMTFEGQMRQLTINFA